MDLSYIGTIILLILGFGFVVFWHELGHFLAAKWAGVKVEQFAIGFGHAMGSWRKGMGFRWGSSHKEYERMLRSDFAAANVGETEYRINWLPLGGYVKMLGQDDLKPGLAVEDPRSYTSKSIGKRMVIVSAGVVMNVILAAILFMALFLMGFRAPPAVVGGLQIGSPAQQVVREDGTPAPLQVGDRFLYFDNKYQHDFTKITLAVALAGQGRVPVYVQRVDGTREHLFVTPARPGGDPYGILMLGFDAPRELKGIDPRVVTLTEEGAKELEKRALKPREVIVAIEGEPVVVDQMDRYDYWKLDRALQQSFGKPVEITIRTIDGREEKRQVAPQYAMNFEIMKSPSFAGMAPRATVEELTPDSAAKGALEPGDAIVKITTQPHLDSDEHPTRERLMELLDKAGQNNRAIDLVVVRDGREVAVPGLMPIKRIKTAAGKRRGLGIGLSVDVEHPVIADIAAESPAAKAGIPRHATIVAIDGKAVKTWFDVHRLLSQATPGTPVELTAARDGAEQKFVLNFSAADAQSIRDIRYTHDLPLAERIEPRRTGNPFVAAAWGVTETRDLIIQAYLTLQRMFQGSLSPSNLIGPIGIVDAGTRIAYKGNDWLIWFLAMISANLAVVNFLPIPIVDGGLFMFLVLEKIMGRPLSPQAQSIAQIVGLALILSVFLFVTYQDIYRMI